MEAGNGSAYGGSVIGNLDLQNGLEKYAGPGHWNDPDMLEVGNGALTTEEERSHFTLWCMLAAPLIAGNDLRHMSPETGHILMNKDVIAIDQDPLGQQAYRASFNQDLEIFIKPLQGGDTAVCLFNRGDQEKKLDVSWAALSVAGNHRIKDVWRGESQGTTAVNYRGAIGRHAVILLKLTRE
jgi:alpha-galactosidase